jgi:hypothetical protein
MQYSNENKVSKELDYYVTLFLVHYMIMNRTLRAMFRLLKHNSKLYVKKLHAKDKKEKELM